MPAAPLPSGSPSQPLPRGCLQKPQSAPDFWPPVPWLLSRQLIAALKYIALYTGFGAQLDHKDWMRAEVHTLESESPSEFWFDYIADSGDGHLPTYNMAFLALNDVWLDPNTASIGYEAPRESAQRLPRGAFLFIGGDTAYHLADYATIAQRFWSPFWWAYSEVPGNPDKRPLFGIPGNHDYYDALHGFNRQFRRSLPLLSSWKFANPPLDIPAFARRQDASYVALKLPFGWWFWGVDAQQGKLDLRQRHFFKGLAEQHGAPDRLIVATPEPTTVLGRRPAADAPHAELFRQLGLETPFVVDEPRLPLGKMRIDLSGDVHHYARYWGPAISRDADAAPNYASVVAGLGGAFQHPSDTRLGAFEPQTLYPDRETSRREFMDRLFSTSSILHGGLVWLVAGLVVLTLVFATALPTYKALLSTLGDHLPRWLGLARGLKDLGTSQGWPHLSAPADAAQPGRPQWAIAFAVLTAATLLYPVFTVWRHAPNEDETWRSFAAWHAPVLLGLSAAAALLVFMPLMDARDETRDLRLLVGDIYLAAGWIIFAATLLWSSAYTAQLAQRAIVRCTFMREYWAAWVVPGFGILTAGMIHWYYGMAPVWLVASDIFVTIVALLATVGLVVVAVAMGAPDRSARSVAVFCLIGLLHVLAQAVLPVLLVRFASMWRLGAAALILSGASRFARQRAASLSPATLLLLWALVLVVELAVAVAGSTVLELSWGRLMCAAVIGAFVGPTWFGWYLAASLVFNGHNNEAGGAARIGKYTQLVRIRLTTDALNAYVIAIDDAQPLARQTRLRLIDSFELRPRA